MKCINKKKRKPMTAKQKAIYQKKLKRTGILGGILVLILLAGILVLVLFSRWRTVDGPLPYDRSVRTFGTSAEEDLLVESGIGGGLCVGADHTSLEGVTPGEGELGGLFDISRKSVPYSQELHEQTSPGELTKLMTALVASEQLDAEAAVTVEESDVIWGGGSFACGLSTGDTISVRQLLNAVLVSSSEDACLALARTAGGSQEGFAALMNQKAQELGMTNTVYTNATGTQDENQVTTVYDTYLLFHALLEHADLINSMGLSSCTLSYTAADGDSRQKWLDTKDSYVSGSVSVPKGVTVLGGKYSSSQTSNYGAMLAQNQYGDVYAAVVFQAGNQSSMYERLSQMLQKINS